jgi:putative cell wall-binding protein
MSSIRQSSGSVRDSGKTALKVTVFALAVCAALLLVPGTAGATPYLISPGDGGQLPSTAQIFTWGDTYAEGPLDHWYMEISTSPLVDYYPWGYFAGNLVYTANGLKTATVDLNAVGRALGPGTYYWHVLGYYGPWGSAGTSWTTVRSFTVQSATVTAPRIAVNPSSLAFTVAQGDTSIYSQIVDISNSGGGTMHFDAFIPSPYPPWLDIIAGTSTGYVYSLPVRVMGSAMAPGQYSWKVRIQDGGSSPAITNSPVDVPVTLNVLAAETSPPTGTSVLINGGAATTGSHTVTLRLAATDSGSGMGEMRLSNDGVTWTGWIPYATSKTWVLSPGTGTKTVRAQFRDKLRNTSGTVTDSIVVEEVSRLSDRTRFSTAVAIAREGFPGWVGVKHVVIASGDDRAAADPLAASGLCWAYDAPMLLVSASRTPDEVKTAISQITGANGKVTLHVVGGPISVPDARLAELVASGGGAAKVTASRILATGGRYDLAAAIALRMKSVASVNPAKTMPPVALIANGADSNKFFDALALSPIAAGTGSPILLVTATSVPPATVSALNTLKPTTKIVGGGPNTVNDSVRSQLGATRWAGRTRYDTAIAIANGAVSKGWLNSANVGVAAKLPDALTGGGFVGQRRGVLLLTDGAALTPVTQSWLASYKAQVLAVHVFGGQLSVTEPVRAAIVNAIK